MMEWLTNLLALALGIVFAQTFIWYGISVPFFLIFSVTLVWALLSWQVDTELERLKKKHEDLR